MKKKIINSVILTTVFILMNIFIVRNNVLANSSTSTENMISSEATTSIKKPSTTEKSTTEQSWSTTEIPTSTEKPTTTEVPTSTEKSTTTEVPDKINTNTVLYSVLTSSSIAYKGAGTADSPYRYLCTSNCQIKGSFVNMIRGYNADGSKKIGNSLVVILEVRQENKPSGSLIKSLTLYGSRETQKNPIMVWDFDSYIDGKEESTTTESCKHKFTKWIVAQKATALKKGYKVRVCSNCGHSESAIIKKLKAKVTLKKKTITIKKKKSYTLKIKSKTYGDKISKWTSKNKKIAAVNSKGKVTGKKKGTTTIILKMKSGAKATCKVKVK